MGTNWYVVCHECQEHVTIGKQNLSGFAVWSKEPTTICHLFAWLRWHMQDDEADRHGFVLMNEHELIKRYSDYESYEDKSMSHWCGIPSDDIPDGTRDAYEAFIRALQNDRN